MRFISYDTCAALWHEITYDRMYKNGKFIPMDDSLDYGANFSHMLGFDSPQILHKWSSESLRRFGWIILAYIMPTDAQHIVVLRVLVREDFSWGLAERLISNIEQVLKEMESSPSHASTKAATLRRKIEKIENYFFHN